MEDDDFGVTETALVPTKHVSLIPAKKRSNSELVLELAKNEGNAALVAVLDRMNQLENVNSSIKEVIMAARDLEKNYTIPGQKRFQRVVRLRKALDELEGKARKGRIS